MSAGLEIPFRPGWLALEPSRAEPPMVPVEPRWEYKEVVREVSSGLMFEAELTERHS